MKANAPTFKEQSGKPHALASYQGKHSMSNAPQLRVLLLIVFMAVFNAQSAAFAGERSRKEPAIVEHHASRQEVPKTSQGEPQQQSRPPEYSISLESNLVVLDVLVTEEDGNVLGNLKKENFRVLDNGKPQIITHFAPTDDPVTIVILMEYSGLAYDYFAYKAAYWGSGFLSHLDGKDWVALITYDMRPTIRVDFTRNKAEVQDALSTLSYPGFGEANLFDAVLDTLEKLEHVQGKKSILLITTGADTFSKATLDETMDRLKQNDVTIFCVGVAESEYQMAQTRSGVSAIGYLQSKNQLQTFANLTGGIAYFPSFEGEIPDIFRSVVGFLRNEYDLGFSPSTESLDGKYHKLKVEIVARDGRPLRIVDKKGRTRKVIVYAREGYVAKKATSKP
jgi:VWFA-related protein